MIVIALLPLLQSSSGDLNRILDDAKFKGALVAAYVSDLSGQEIYTRNADLRLMPGSNQKLVTSALALSKLGEHYRPTTRIWKQRDRIVVDATGDPLTTYAEWKEISRKLGSRRKLPVYVRSAFGPVIPISWEWDDLPNKYAAKVSALTVDRGSFELWNVGGRPHLKPASYGVKIVREPGDTLTIRYEPEKRLLKVVGPLPKETKRLDTLALPDPEWAAASILGSRLDATSTLPQSEPSAVIPGASMADMMREMLVESDNNVAETMFLLATGAKGNDSGLYGRAQEEAARILATIGLESWEARAYDGSGLSRHNLITARALGKLLRWSANQFWSGLWFSSLATHGLGTLKGRLETVPFAGKTGTLDMVTALSGYLTLRDGRVVVASILVNHYASTTAEARVLVDSFIKKLLEHGSAGTLIASTSHENEGSHPNPLAGAAPGHRFHRPLSYGNPSRPGQDRGDEPTYEGVHRAERILVRAG